jgi:hypothetical protein
MGTPAPPAGQRVVDLIQVRLALGGPLGALRRASGEYARMGDVP